MPPACASCLANYCCWRSHRALICAAWARRCAIRSSHPPPERVLPCLPARRARARAATASPLVAAYRTRTCSTSAAPRSLLSRNVRAAPELPTACARALCSSGSDECSAPRPACATHRSLPLGSSPPLSHQRQHACRQLRRLCAPTRVEPAVGHLAALPLAARARARACSWLSASLARPPSRPAPR